MSKILRDIAESMLLVAMIVTVTSALVFGAIPMFYDWLTIEVLKPLIEFVQELLTRGG